MGDIPSLTSSQRYVMTPMTGQMPTRRATETAMEETDDVLLMDMVKLQSDGGICLGAFGDVGKMTAKTVDFLIHVLEDRKQELVMNGEDKNGSERTSDAGKDDTSKEGKDSSVSRIFSFGTTTNDGADVTELVRSHSYEALVQLEEILEARHNRLMNDGMLESTDDRVD
ncbi:unnamed protein product [Peronospora farinosa]|uniref:Uncharacterized protein n=1 Tax=Peronospora farinosa TaxID=134698 RepID=A0AAV0SYJ9_9STRA|nr:unnamed protein product [Peronospora farinosa]CAI5710615.1 unnamed protein product [Peronospora farinosa]